MFGTIGTCKIRNLCKLTFKPTSHCMDYQSSFRNRRVLYRCSGGQKRRCQGAHTHSAARLGEGSSQRQGRETESPRPAVPENREEEKQRGPPRPPQPARQAVAGPGLHGRTLSVGCEVTGRAIALCLSLPSWLAWGLFLPACSSLRSRLQARAVSLCPLSTKALTQAPGTSRW